MKMVNPLVRNYQPSDQQKIEQIQLESQADLKASTPAGYFDDLSQIAQSFRDGAFLVAIVDEEVAGYGGLLPTGEIVRMRVARKYRRRGIASALLTQLVAHARQLHFNAVHLHTLEEQESAQNLYRRFGFRESGRGILHGNNVVALELKT